MNITEPLRRHALERPDAPAIVRPDGAIVLWRDVDRLVDDLARRCLDAGIVPGDIVTLAIRRPLRLLLLELALARLGAAGASPAIGADVASACLAEGGAEKRPHAQTVAVDEHWFALRRDVAVAPVPSWPDADALAIVCPSSGTTGVPKAIPVTHAQLAARVASANAAVAPTPASSQICMPGASSGFGIVSILRVLWAGGTHVIALTPEEIVAAVPRAGVNRIVLMPLWIERIVDALPAGRSLALDRVEVGGAFLAASLQRLARERLGRDVVSIYGATEVGFIAMGAYDVLDTARGEVGRVLPGLEVAAFGAGGNAIAAGGEGVLRVRGPAVCGRYLGDARSTAESFVDGWLVTPDVGSVAADGTVTLAGRLGDVISVGGYKVRPAVVEDALLSIPAIRDAAAFGAPNIHGVMQLCAAIVAAVPIDAATLAAELRARIPGMVPALVFRVLQVPRNAGGKVEREALLSMAVASGVLT